MKIRSNFVSNSSSSSFVVQAKPFVSTKPEYLLEPEELKKLLEYGFEYSKRYLPISIEECNTSEWKTKEETHVLACSVPCNEDWVIAFLVRNNIPFHGVTHYGHYSVVFKKDSKYIVKIRNPGIEYNMYGRRTEEPKATDYIEDAVTHVPIEEYYSSEYDKDPWEDDYEDPIKLCE